MGWTLLLLMGLLGADAVPAGARCPRRSCRQHPYTVDNERFIACTRQTPQQRAVTRARLGIKSEALSILYAAKFDRRKRPDDLVRAYSQLRKEGITAELVMVKSGALESELKAPAGQFGLGGVTFPGFINQAELPSVYGACDIFVSQSENEPWGLAVNETRCARGLHRAVRGDRLRGGPRHIGRQRGNLPRRRRRRSRHRAQASASLSRRSCTGLQGKPGADRAMELPLVRRCA